MLNKVKLIIYITSALLTISGAFGVKIYYDKYKSMQTEMYAYRNNQKAYESIISNNEKDKRALSLNNTDLRFSNDKLIHSIDSVRKSFKKAANRPGDVSAGISTSIRDTVVITLPIKDSCSFDTTIIHNEFTKSRIILKDNQLKDIIEVNNTEYLYVYSSREFVNTYKHGISRLFHLDWHKETIDRYEVVNTNKLIQVNDIRVIKIRE